MTDFSGRPRLNVIKTLIESFPTRDAAAAAGGVSTDQIHRYMRGENEPRFDVVARMALAAGVSLDGLIALPASPVRALSDEARDLASALHRFADACDKDGRK